MRLHGIFSIREGGSRRGVFPIRAVVGAGFVTAIANLPVYFVGALAVVIRPDLGFESTGTGAAVSVFMATSSLAGLALGGWVQRWHPSMAVRVASGTTGLAMLGIAAFARNWAILAALLVIAGAANATGQMAANMVLAETSTPGKDGLAFGMKQAAVPLATMLAGASVSVALGAIDWRWVFVFGAGLAAVTAVVVPRFAAGSMGTVGGRAGANHSAKGSVDRMTLRLITLGAFFAAGAATTFAIFLVEFAVFTGWSPGAAGTLLAVASIGVLISRVLAGWISDRRTSRGGSSIALKPISTMLALGSAGVLLVMVGGETPILLATGALLAMLMGWGWPGLMHLSVVSMDRRAAARSTGVISFGIFGGGVVMPFLLGFLAERVSYRVGWGFNAAFLAIAAGSFRWAHAIHVRTAEAEANRLA